jgi:dihydroneopterin aldolase
LTAVPANPPASSDVIHLHTELSCIVGILPRERVDPQRILVEVRMELPLEPVGDTGALELGVDYAAIDTQVRFLAVEGRFRLIESLGLAFLHAILSPPLPGEGRGQVARAWVRISKPEVLRAAVPGIELFRDAEWGARRGPVAQFAEVGLVRRVAAAGERLTGSAGLLLDELRAVSLPWETDASRPVLTLSRP